MAEEIKKTEDLNKAEETAAQDVQKLSDDALDEVAGGSGWAQSDATVFADKIGPELWKLADLVKAGEDRNKVWAQNIGRIKDLIDIHLPSGTQFNILYAKEWFETACTVA